MSIVNGFTARFRNEYKYWAANKKLKSPDRNVSYSVSDTTRTRHYNNNDRSVRHFPIGSFYVLNSVSFQ